MELLNLLKMLFTKINFIDLSLRKLLISEIETYFNNFAIIAGFQPKKILWQWCLKGTKFGNRASTGCGKDNDNLIHNDHMHFV